MKSGWTIAIAMLAAMGHAWGVEEEAAKSESPAPLVVCFGDSITAGKYPEYLEEMLPEFCIVNAGVGGNTTGQGLARLEEDVLSLNPDVVLILFGTNDSVMRKPGSFRTSLEDFEKNLRRIVERCREQGARPILGTLLPIIAEPYYTRHPKEYYAPEGGLKSILERYRNKTIEMGNERGVPVVDFYEKIPGDLSMLKPDGVHPNAAGLKTIAKLFAGAVRALEHPSNTEAP